MMLKMALHTKKKNKPVPPGEKLTEREQILSDKAKYFNLQSIKLHISLDKIL